MSFLGLFLECDYSHYVVCRVPLRRLRLYIGGKYKRGICNFKIYFGELTLFNGMVRR